MKKLLLSSGLLAMFFAATAQQKLALFEEFSGENCGPCAQLNPALMTKMANNEGKVLLLKYQSPIPSAGPIYEQNTIFTDNRMDYYEVPFAPYGRLNGATFGSGQQAGNIDLLNQTMIDEASSGIAPFTITITNPVYSSDGQTFTSNVTVTANVAGNYNQLILRFVLAEQLDYTQAPGSNGETSFHNVVRQMYPNANGQSVQGTWTSGESHTFTITGAIPSYVNPASAHRFFAAFLQTDGDKKVLQAAKTNDITIQLPQVDVASSKLEVGNGLLCELPTTITPVSTIKNTGVVPLTSATIYYRLGTSDPWSTYSWTGNIAPGASLDVSLPNLSITTAGLQGVYDSVALPNNLTDLNDYDNNGGDVAFVLSNTANPLPIAYDFESDNPNWISWPGEGTQAFPFLRAPSQGLGYNGSTYLGYFPAYSLPQGVTGYYLFPKAEMPAGAKALDFYLAYAQFQDANGQVAGDKLEVVYSDDCGDNWTSIWSAANGDLATVPNATSQFVPSASSWKLKSIDISNVPTGAYLAFKATSGYGNNMFIDNIEVRTGEVVDDPNGINDIVKDASINIYPNPVQNDLTVELSLLKATNVSFEIYNVLGQKINTISKDLGIGSSSTNITTSGLSSGIYYLNIVTKEGSVQKKFTKN